MKEPLKRLDKPWEDYCHWCGEKLATRGCQGCRHTFCDGCWDRIIGCPRCYLAARERKACPPDCGGCEAEAEDGSLDEERRDQHVSG
mgnify:CR=1 FL=1